MKFTSVHSCRRCCCCCCCCSPFSLSYLSITSSRPRWTKHNSISLLILIARSLERNKHRVLSSVHSPSAVSSTWHSERYHPRDERNSIRLSTMACCFCAKYLLLFFNLIIWVRISMNLVLTGEENLFSYDRNEWAMMNNSCSTGHGRPEGTKSIVWI